MLKLQQLSYNKFILIDTRRIIDKLDLLEMGHVGNKDYLKFIRRMKPKLAISGHLHETVGVMDKIDKTQIVNPGWDGMVIELN